MSDNNESVTKVISGIGLCDLLFTLFLGLKLGHVIDWSWWWVTAPLWGQVVLVAVVVIVVLLIALVSGFIRSLKSRIKRNKDISDD